MKRNLREKSISLFLALAMVIQTILPTLVSAQEKASADGQTAILWDQGILDSQEYAILLDPSSLEADQQAKALILQLQKEEIKEEAQEDVIVQTEQTEQEAQTQDQAQVSTLVFHKSLALSDQTLQDLEAAGHTVETPADLALKAQDQDQAGNSQVTDLDLASDPDLVSDQNLTNAEGSDTTVIVSESKKTDEASQDEQAVMDLPNYGPTTTTSA